MKLLLVSVKSEISHGGIAVWTDRFLKSCRERGVDCLLVNTELVGKRATQLGAKRNLWDELVRTRRIFCQLRQQLKKKPDVAHINTSCGTFGLIRDYLIASKIRKAGVKLITHYHCEIEHWVRNPISHFFLKRLASISWENLVLTKGSRVFLQENYGIESMRLPNYLEDEQIGTPKSQVSETVRTALYVGRVEVEKGSWELYEVAKRCPQIRFLLIGEISPDAKGWQIPENVELLGPMPHDRVLQRMEKADIFFFPSHSEGGPVALMEAAAHGLPMIATTVGASSDVVGEGGLLVPVGDVDAMVQALKQLQNPKLRQKMSRAAVENIRQNFSKEQMEILFSVIFRVAEKK